MRTVLLALCGALLLVAVSVGTPAGSATGNGTPVVTNVVAAQRSGTRLVDVTYDVDDLEGDTLTIWIYLSPDGGASYPISCGTVQGDAGTGITIGTAKHIEWNAGADYPGHLGDNHVIKVIADDGHGHAGMAWIPAGNVRLGQTGIAEPVNDFFVDGFVIDVHEVSNAKYKEFIDAGGYQTESWWNPVGWTWRVADSITLPRYWNDSAYHGGGIPGNGAFPVNGVSWWEADAYCRWAGDRLPTEAEWEKAAKGGCETHGDYDQCDASDTSTFPWGEEISGPQANYYDSGDPYENNGWTTPVGHYDGGNHGGYQTIDSPSPYGLYDVAGNVWEWCSTRSASYPYNPDDGREAPPATSSECCRRMRGGGWTWPSDGLRCAYRGSDHPNCRDYTVGFRCARSSTHTFGWGASPAFPLDTSTGACCASVGTCTITFLEGCLIPSLWQGAFTACDPNPCLAGACCIYLVCEIHTPADCAARGGIYEGNGHLCQPDPCPTSSIEGGSGGALSLSLHATPNPTTGDVLIQYDLPTATSVTLEIFSAGGALVRRVEEGERPAGRHTVSWDGRDAVAHPLPSGFYLARITTNEGSTTARVVVAK